MHVKMLVCVCMCVSVCMFVDVGVSVHSLVAYTSVCVCVCVCVYIPCMYMCATCQLMNIHVCLYVRLIACNLFLDFMHTKNFLCLNFILLFSPVIFLQLVIISTSWSASPLLYDRFWFILFLLFTVDLVPLLDLIPMCAFSYPSITLSYLVLPSTILYLTPRIIW